MSTQALQTTTRAQPCHQAIRDAIHRLGEQLKAGRSDALKTYLAMLGRLHRYSWGNLLLICKQYPTATHVAGFRAWTKLGRRVRKGQRGIRILAPVRYARSDATDAATPSDENDTARDRGDIRGFRNVYVFDVSQTDGKPLPEPATVQGDVSRWLPRLIEWLQGGGIAVVFEPLPPGVYGSSAGGRITLASGNPPAATFATLVHEAAHELLHHPPKDASDKSSQGDQDASPSLSGGSKTVRETEAEAVAYAVCSGLGLKVGTACSDYIQLYDGTTQTLAASLQRISDTASRLLTAIQGDPQARANQQLVAASSAAGITPTVA